MIVMQTMRRLAPQHGLMFLIHEKPFAGINGSGKHNNWSMATDEGENLLDPGTDPHANAQFLAFLVGGHPRRQRARRHPAGVDRRRRQRPSPGCQRGAAGDHVDLPGLAARGRDRQLEQGAASASKQGGTVDLGVTSLPELPKDATDRNRTSPFAFTGNKFEFRAVGSSAPDLLAADGPQHRRRRLAQRARGRARQAQARRLRRPDQDPVGHRQARTSRSCSRATTTPRNGTPRPRAAGCPNNKTTPDALPALDDAQGQGAVLDVRRALGARAPGPRGHQLGALRQGRRHRGERRARHRPDHDPAGGGRATSASCHGGDVVVARPSRSSARTCRELTDTLVDRDRRPRARAARGARGRLGRGRGAGVRRQGHPGPERAARGRPTTRDGRRRRPVAAAEVPGAPVPVLSLRGRVAGLVPSPYQRAGPGAARPSGGQAPRRDASPRLSSEAERPSCRRGSQTSRS